MEPLGIAAIGAVHGLFVFFKAFQQRNVAFLHYWWVVPISYCMAAADVFVVSMVAIRAVESESLLALIPLALSIGTGSMIGALVAMWSHDRWVGKTPKITIHRDVEERHETRI